MTRTRVKQVLGANSFDELTRRESGQRVDTVTITPDEKILFDRVFSNQQECVSTIEALNAKVDKNIGGVQEDLRVIIGETSRLKQAVDDHAKETERAFEAIHADMERLERELESLKADVARPGKAEDVRERGRRAAEPPGRYYKSVFS